MNPFPVQDPCRRTIPSSLSCRQRQNLRPYERKLFKEGGVIFRDRQKSRRLSNHLVRVDLVIVHADTIVSRQCLRLASTPR